MVEKLQERLPKSLRLTRRGLEQWFQFAPQGTEP
uniref:Uncharacterized protein n=1 Tax=Anguilla anguilla TaxID=7936 RepID=A0A0E9W024_ANGAN